MMMVVVLVLGVRMMMMLWKSKYCDVGCVQ